MEPSPLIQSGLSFLAWEATLADISYPFRDPYFTPGYHQLHEMNGDGKAECSAVRERDAILLVPGMQTPIPPLRSLSNIEPCWDVQTCNGYGGPLATRGATAQFLEKAWSTWREECRRRNIIAAFFRLHPLLQNERFLPRDARVVRDRQTVFLDLDLGLDELRARAKSRYRNMINKAQRQGVEVSWNDPAAWEQFGAFYGRAMEHLNAPPALRFSLAYFEALCRLPEAEIACVWKRRTPLAASIFLFGTTWCHYHLSARDPEAGNHLHSVILQSALERAAQRGVVGLHLGGGRTAAANDGLLRFKLSTGGRLLDFKVALVVADQKNFEKLCVAWRYKCGREPSWLLAYRQPASTTPQFDLSQPKENG